MCALIPAAGRGLRFGAAENKVFALLLGRPLLGWTLQAFADCPAIDDVILIGSESDLPRLREIGAQFGGGKVRDVVVGGADRQASVRNGLAACPDAEYIVVHDAARPCVTPAMIENVLMAASNVGGNATVAVPVSDTLIKEGRWYDQNGGGPIGQYSERIARDGLWAVQTPQAFNAQGLRIAHAKAAEIGFTATDDTAVYQKFCGPGGWGYLLMGSPDNIKVTRPEDLTIVEAVLARRSLPPFPLPSSERERGESAHNTGFSNEAVTSLKAGTETRAVVSDYPLSRSDEGGGKGGREFRIGTGYDVHPFAPASDNRTLYLGGVSFPDHPRGLAGHSDADVLLHALCDALLGAAGLPDIGHLFPPSDDRHKNRASLEFLQEVAARLTEGGWQVANVDMTVIAEAPKINHRASEMKAKIAVVLGIGLTEVGIKATTSEGLGFIGRGEGIAAHATALLWRP